VVIQKTFRGFKEDSRINRAVISITLLLIVLFFLNLIVNSYNVYQTAWGVFGRNNGVISYVALMVIFLAAMRVSHSDLNLVLRIFRMCGNMVLVYALIQMLDLDPFDWTGEGPFSTLGNLNFSAAFLAIHASYLIALAFLEETTAWHTRSWFAIIAIVDMFVVWKTTSIQGLGIFGITVVLLLIRKFTLNRNKFAIPAILVSFSSGFVVFLGSFGVGPLKILRQETMLFRLDYWSAGISMLRSNPIVGIGMDSYGNYYREYRNEVAANRNYFDRVTNTAHNIPIDVAAGAGVVAGILYLSILLIFGFFALRAVINSKKNIDLYLALMAIGFIFQQFVSINQIGLATWGWILLGLFMSSSREEALSNIPRGSVAIHKDSFISKQKTNNKSIRPNSSRKFYGFLYPGLGFFLGVSLVWAPMSADLKFYSAVRSSDIKLQAEIARGLGGNQFLMENALKSAVAKNDPALIEDLATELVDKYSRSYFGWQVLAGLITRSQEDRLRALEELRKLDPLNTEIPAEPLG
jgi:O-antigen ligase